jgi:hypothetical protein
LQYESVLTSVIEVGIATAGFSGIIAVLGRRSQGEWRTADLVRMSILLQASFAAILLSFLPMVLDGAGLSEPTVWRIASACFIAYAAIFGVRRLRQIRRAVANDPSVSPGFFC